MQLSALILVFIFFQSFTCKAATDSTGNSIVFSHNDYAQAVPFSNAYGHGVGFIEADIFLRHDSLFVAHEITEIDVERTLKNMYLDSLAERIKSNAGTIYPDAKKSLILMIDLKTNGVLTMPILLQALKAYPNLISGNNNLKIAVSGDMPSTSTWDKYPSYIFFDGRPSIDYDSLALKRVALVSTNFKNYSNWNGDGLISEEEDRKIITLIDEIHYLKKQVRFWATPDNENTWQYLMKRKVDILGTDKVNALCTWLSSSR